MRTPEKLVPMNYFPPYPFSFHTHSSNGKLPKPLFDLGRTKLKQRNGATYPKTPFSISHLLTQPYDQWKGSTWIKLASMVLSNPCDDFQD